MSGKSKALFHAAFFSMFVIVAVKDYQVLNGQYLPIPYNFFSRFVWLTLIDLYAQIFYHFYGFIKALSSPNQNARTFDYMARVIVGPIGVAVTVLFWTLWIFDPATLAKDEMAKKIHSIQWFNHGLHTLPLISSHLDVYLWKHQTFPQPTVMKGIMAFCVLYVIDIHAVYYISGFWAYPILGQLAPPFRIFFIVSCIFIVFICHIWLSSFDLAVDTVAGRRTIKAKRR
ncbi:unnamed protein product [Caenorhabditis bovis]|uniref:Uncharacterized protein n=1 Tax=Caenorhabditis bovis TaxID=2654633 RepID=A0A8S1EF10_9PELO|nr:unnamed protein product [Caenorhabditis bovis]